MALSRLLSTVLTTASSTAAGGTMTTSEVDFGADTRVDAAHVYTRLLSGAWAASPAGNDTVTVRLIGRTVPTGVNSVAPPAYVREHRVTKNGPYQFHDIFENPPRYCVLQVTNVHSTKTAATGITVQVECIKET